ncbi:MAG: rRNA maturation RNase YbeY [Clostridiales bacterium]|jgi:probable rRNA maturation factor|nr:rRNA maturation RNase YbeY [Clostridiales bacterium]
MLTLYDFPTEFTGDIERVYKATLRYFGQRDIFEVEACNVSKGRIKKINRDTRGIDKATDVLSYPNLANVSFPIKKSGYKSDINPETGLIVLGEIVVCYDKIAEQAREFGHGERRECCYLFLHGLLHLFGFDHENDADKAKMRNAEEEILKGIAERRGL